MAGSQMTASYALPRRKTTERNGDETYQFTWRGDEVQSVTPNLNFLPFSPTMPGSVVGEANELPPETDPLPHINRRKQVPVTAKRWREYFPAANGAGDFGIDDG